MKKYVYIIFAAFIAASGISSCSSAKTAAASHDSVKAAAGSSTVLTSDSVAFTTETSHDSASFTIDSVAIVPDSAPCHDTAGFRPPVVMLYGLSLRSDISTRLDNWKSMSSSAAASASRSSETHTDRKTAASDPKPRSHSIVLVLAAIIVIFIAIGSRLKK